MNFSRLHVGPQSAGAVPGPVSYGTGGTEATTTDANLALGCINPHYFCGGTMEADMGAVRWHAGQAGRNPEISRQEAARGIVRIANNNMVNAIKLISVNRGHDPRDFTLIAFGGGGGMHACALARELSIKKVVIPKQSECVLCLGHVAQRSAPRLPADPDRRPVRPRSGSAARRGPAAARRKGASGV